MAVGHEESQAISEEEAQLYDRQIRLWGLESQKRLRAARVLVAGMKGLGCEVAKNLVLAGVHSLTALDHENLDEEDGDVQFLAPRDKIGSNRAEASLDRLRELNPGVDVSADTGHLDSKDEAYFVARYDVIVVTHYTKESAVRVDRIARKAGIKFFCGDVFGHFGYAFTDLNRHDFVVEELVKKDDCRPPEAKKAKAEEPETKMSKRSMEFVSLESALSVDWTADGYKKRLRRMDAAGYFLLVALFEFQSREGRSPQTPSRQEDLKLLERLADDVAKKNELPAGCKLVSDPGTYLDLVFSQLSPVAAIVGGVLAQEIIKSISKKDKPHNNFFFYNPLESTGSFEAVGY